MRSIENVLDIRIGLLGFLVVLIVHVESEQVIRVISMRKATSDETDLVFQNAGDV